MFLSNHNVTVVPSLSEARAHLDATSYDLLLVDYDLNDGKGTELVRELRSRGLRTRIIGVSAREKGNEALSKSGVDAVCSKMNFDRIQSLI